MDKFLKIKCDGLNCSLLIHKHSKIVEKPVPILWNHKGTYGWVPVGIVINEIDKYLNNEKICPGLGPQTIEFTWQQVYPLRQDVGKILEEMGNV